MTLFPWIYNFDILVIAIYIKLLSATIEVATRAGKFTKCTDSLSTAVCMTRITVRKQCPFVAYNTYLTSQ